MLYHQRKMLENFGGAKMERKFSINNFVKDYHDRWRKSGREELEFKLQSEIEEIESDLSGAKQIRSKRYQTPLGTIHLKRRAYPIEDKLVCVADQLLGLPDSGWLPQVEELAVALGISSEFTNAQKLFTKLTGIEITDRTLANRVEGIGEDLSDFESEEIIEEIQAVDTVLTASVKKKKKEK